MLFLLLLVLPLVSALRLDNSLSLSWQVVERQHTNMLGTVVYRTMDVLFTGEYYLPQFSRGTVALTFSSPRVDSWGTPATHVLVLDVANSHSDVCTPSHTTSNTIGNLRCRVSNDIVTITFNVEYDPSNFHLHSTTLQWLGQSGHLQQIIDLSQSHNHREHLTILSGDRSYNDYNDHSYNYPSTTVPVGYRAKLYGHGVGMSVVFGVVYPVLVVLSWKVEIAGRWKSAVVHSAMWTVFCLLLGVFWMMAPKNADDMYDSRSIAGDLAYYHKTIGKSVLVVCLLLFTAAHGLSWLFIKKRNEIREYVLEISKKCIFIAMLFIGPLVCFTGWRRHSSSVSYACIAFHMFPPLLAVGLFWGFDRFKVGSFIQRRFGAAENPQKPHDSENPTPFYPGFRAGPQTVRRAEDVQLLPDATEAAVGPVGLVGRVVEVRTEGERFDRVVLAVPGLRAAGQTVTLLGTNRKLCCVEVKKANEGVFLVDRAELGTGATVGISRVSRELLALPTQMKSGTMVVEELGIVPAISMMKNKSSSVNIWLFWVVRNMSELLLLDEVKRLTMQDTSIDVTVVFTDATQSISMSEFPFRCMVGTVDQDLVADNILDVTSSLLVLGNQSFVAWFAQFAEKQKNFPPNQIFTLPY